MRTRERIIRDRFSERSCGRCGAPYAPESVLILARRAAHWMVMVSCPHCQQRNVFVVSFADGHDAPTLDDAALASEGDLPLAPPPLPSAPAQSHPSSLTRSPSPSSSASSFSPAPITTADVAGIREFLASFSGDFRALFSTPRPRLKDDPPSSA